MAEDQPPQLFDFVTSVCGNAAAQGEGLVVAIEDGYSVTPSSVSDVFLRVDSVAAHSPQCTFRNSALGALMSDAVLPTVGVLDASAQDAEAWALKVGYARDRVFAYQKIKSVAMQPGVREYDAECADVRKDLVSCEDHVMKKNSVLADMLDTETYNKCKRTAWDARDQQDRAPSLMDNLMATGITREQIDGMATGDWGECGEHAASRDGKLGTERFIAFTFAPPTNEVLVAANATGSGVRIDENLISYPAYVTVHNSKGAIEHLPATASESQPNSVIVPCAASLLCELHALSAKAGRNHVLIAHALKTEL